MTETWSMAYHDELSGNGGLITDVAAACFLLSGLGHPDAETSPPVGSPTFYRAIIDGDTPSANTEVVWVLAQTGNHVTDMIRAAESFPGGCAAGSPVAHDDGVPFKALMTPRSMVRAQRPPGVWTPNHFGLLTWSFDLLWTLGTSGSSVTSGTVSVAAMPVAEPIPLTNLVAYVSDAPGTPADLTHAWLGVYDHAGTFLGATADDPVAFQTVGRKAIPVSGGPLAFTPATPDDYVYVASLILSSGTMPTLGNFNYDASNNGPITLPVGPTIASDYATGQTALPGSLDLSQLASHPSSYAPWLAVS